MGLSAKDVMFGCNKRNDGRHHSEGTANKTGAKFTTYAQLATNHMFPELLKTLDLPEDATEEVY